MLFTSNIYFREIQDGSFIRIFIRSSLQCSPNPSHATAIDDPPCLFRTLLSTHSNAYCEGKMTAKHRKPHLSFQHIFPQCKIAAPESALSPLQDTRSRHGIRIMLVWHSTCQSTRGCRAARLDHPTSAGPLDSHHFHSLISSV